MCAAAAKAANNHGKRLRTRVTRVEQGEALVIQASEYAPLC
jgi:hypothetical protein